MYQSVMSYTHNVICSHHLNKLPNNWLTFGFILLHLGKSIEPVIALVNLFLWENKGFFSRRMS